jgi:hypothetical protein
MNRRTIQLILVVTLVRMEISTAGVMHTPLVAAQGASDLYMRDTPLDTGVEPNPDTGPMWVTEDIWVRTTPDLNYQPFPFVEASPPWTPSPHENPEYRDPQYSSPNYVYVRVRNRGSSASTGTERLRLYWAKASTGLSWPTQWVDYVVTSGSSNILYGAEVTKARKNVATATQTERDAYRQAILDVGTLPSFVFPGGTRYWHMQNIIHQLSSVQTTGHVSPAFFPWHREMLSRYELLLQEADPTVKLLYWDWTKDPAGTFGGASFNYFTSNFMGASGRGTGGVSIGPPFIPSSGPSLSPPPVQRNLTNGAPPALADTNLLNIGATDTNTQPVSYPLLRTTTENCPYHNCAHNYFQGTVSIPATAAQDPFFFLLHANVDRIWAQWQRSNLRRLNPATAYGLNASAPTITSSLPPWDGTAALRPWTLADGYIVNKTSSHPSIVSPPIYDTAPLVIPVLQPGEAVVIEIPWYAPNPADFATFGGDQGHFCLLARIETSDAAPFGMTSPEGTDIYTNTRNNNNIVWKNITVVDNFPGALRLTSILIRNPFDGPVLTGLRFANPAEFGPSFFDIGRILVDLKPELFERWRAGGGVGQGIEPTGETTIQIVSPEAFIGNIKLDPEETFSIDVQFELSKEYTPLPGVLPKWDLIQVGTPENPEAIVGGQRFEINFSRLVLVESGSFWRYLDDGSVIENEWNSLDFDDSKWKLGKADLGFGNNPITTIDGGSLDNRHITTYFRHTFEVTDPSFIQSFYMRLQRNDGAVVYLNGKEIHRINLPEDQITPSTAATRDVEGLERETFFEVQLDPGFLLLGKNVVAVEIHLASPSSRDLSFDLELFANPADDRFPPNVSFSSPLNGALVQIGQVIPIQVEALSGGGRTISVSLLEDGNIFATDDDPPYSFQWEGSSLGSHQLRAVALDSEQQQSMTDLTVTVLENTPPSATLTQPDDGAVFRADEAIPVSAEASDNNGEVTRVEFYLVSMDVFADPDLVGTVEAAPYEISLTDVAPGHYMLYALAIDEGTVTGQSLSVHIEVQGTNGGAHSMPGDLNGNGHLDTGDATKALRMIVGLDPATLEADLNQNGRLDTGDVTLILKAVVNP